jgi:serine/threonine protein kinase
MRTIRHPNIVEFHDLIVDKNHTYLVEEFCEEGDLGFHIRRQIKKKKTFFPE